MNIVSTKKKKQDGHPKIKVNLIYNGKIIEDPSTLTIQNPTVDRIINATVDRKLATLNLEDFD